MAQQFRTSFRVADKTALLWFPGHMGKGLKQMQRKLKSVDCVVEVHDARIPLSGRNPNFKYTVSGAKPHILVFNKSDLAGKQWEQKVEDEVQREGYKNVLFTNAKNQMSGGVEKIVPLAAELIRSSERYNRSENREHQIMVIGVPNVGKSSIINALRNRYLKKRSAAPVGAVAGITRSVQNRIKVSENPPVYLFDTPGILTPSVKDIEGGLRLAVCAAFPDHLVGEILIADYLLYILNKYKNFQYTDLMHLREPSDNITNVLATSAIHMKKVKKLRDVHNNHVLAPDLAASAAYFIRAFREGELGQFMLDRDLIN